MHRLWRGIIAAVFGFGPLTLTPAAHAEPVAVTVDDLPLLSVHEDATEAGRVAAKLTTALRRCDAAAVGFVVGEKFEDAPAVRRRLLQTWVRGGVALGNHTYSHDSLNRLTPEAYEADIARTDALLAQLRGGRARSPLWFRHPFLETGPTAAARGEVESWLTAHGYRVAPVTLEADDDLFAAPYEDALLRGDTATARRVKTAYLGFTRARIAWYRDAGRTLLGRRPPLVLLIHATPLNADAFPQVCRELRRQHLKPARLSTVLRDPAYRLPEGPATTDGDDWLNRWAAALGRDLPWDSFPEAPDWIQQAAAKLDPDEHRRDAGPLPGRAD